MNHIVPDFETDEEFIIPNLPNKSAMGGEEDIMELLWHNGQVVLQSQNQRSVGNKKAEIRNRENRSSVVEEQIRSSDVFMQEDEMASWLHYPIGDDSFENYLYGNDLNIYPAPPSSVPIAAASTSIPPPPPPSVIIPSRPPVPPSRRVEGESQSKNTNFLHFERANNDRSAPAAKAPESRASRISDEPAAISVGGGIKGAAGTTSVGREMETCDMSVTSSPGSGGSGASEPLCQKLPPSDDRKRKGIDADDNEGHTEDAEFEFADAKKQPQGGSTSTKKSRAAEVHNLSERRRRDRINEKMKALQELIPRCNKVDKASMLDEAIEYLKSLQMQVQMMSMGCNMVPMMFPGVQQYMPTMGMGMSMGMGMNMGMDMGMNRAMVPYPAIHPGSSLPNPAAAAHLSQRFAVPGYNMLPVTVAGPTASQAANMTDPMMNPLTLNSQNQPGVPNFADPFQHYLVLHQTQLPLPQNQGGVPQATDANNPDHHQTR